MGVIECVEVLSIIFYVYYTETLRKIDKEENCVLANNAAPGNGSESLNGNEKTDYRATVTINIVLLFNIESNEIFIYFCSYYKLFLEIYGAGVS